MQFNNKDHWRNTQIRMGITRSTLHPQNSLPPQSLTSDNSTISSQTDPTMLQEKPYSCSLCSFRTAYQSNLTAHLRTHTGERPYLCPHCPAKFARKSHLQQHLTTHTGEKPYTCHYCSYRSSRISYLKRHLETHTR